MRLGRLWAFAAASGALAALVLFDTNPGINWPAWTILTIAGLLAVRRPDPPAARAMALPLGFAVLLAIGASITTTEPLLVAIVAMVASLMALSVVIAPRGDSAGDYGALDIVTAPIRGLWQTMRGATALVADTAASAGGTRQRPVLRGALMAVPVVVILALLFASADPVLGRGRDLLENALGSLEALPRVIFGILAALFAGSAYYGSRLLRGATGFGTRSATARSDIGITERRIVLASAAVVSWVFVLLQLSYLFGTQPAAAGTGVTFADYARRGFGELCVAATGVALLIVASHQRLPLADESRARRALLWPALALLGAECCVLFSAFHRVTLYESAYGYTRSRVYAQAYMIVTLLVLLALVWHVVGTFDVRRLARQVMTIALATLAVLIFWNGDAWIAGANVNRYAATGKIDVDYLANSLSPDAYPALVRLLPKLPAAERGALVAGLEKHYAKNPALTAAPAWYEWNLRRNAARRIHLSGSAAGVATE